MTMIAEKPQVEDLPAITDEARERMERPPPPGVKAWFGGMYTRDGGYHVFGSSAGGHFISKTDVDLRWKLGGLSLGAAATLIRLFAEQCADKHLWSLLEETMSDRGLLGDILAVVLAAQEKFDATGQLPPLLGGPRC